MKKAEFRSHYKRKRQEITPDQIRNWSKKIGEQLLDLIPVKKPTVHLFLPIKRFKEIDTFLIQKLAIEQFPESKWIISRTNFTEGTLTHFVFDKNTVLVESELGIPEPVDGIETSLNQVNLILVPLLAFDRQGNRIGYGKGFYDRLLNDCPKNCLKVGLSFFEPVSELIETDSWDIPLDICITPGAVHRFTG